jgi:cell division inhibitor SepF
MGIVNQVLGFFGFAASDSTKSDGAMKAKAAPRPRRSSDLSEIVTLDPATYADAKEVAAHYRSGVPVIINIGAMSEADSRRMLDFMIGLKEGLEGHLRRVTSKVFLLSPHNVAVTDAESDEGEPEDLMQ